MKEHISVNNFLVIKKAEIDVKKINIIIGPQANGKSIIAKLLYFFNSTSGHFIRGIRANKSKRDLDSIIINDFEKRFPRYSWENSSFFIRYCLDDIEITLTGKKPPRGKTTLKLSYSDKLSKLFNSKKKLYHKKLQEANEEQKNISRRRNNIEGQIFWECVHEPLTQGEYNNFFSNSVFVPASRTFFANLQKNIFTFLASNLDIDPFLKEFGSLYETSKRWYKDSYLTDKHKELSTQFYKAMEAVVDGDYEYHDEQDWINSKGRRINLANASSGQQESLPMLLTLCVWPMLRSDEEGSIFFIEEPEAHLFPTSQGYIVSILSLLYSNLGTRFFLTTHSPYILSALNNFILAGDSVKSGKMTPDEFNKINGSGLPIDFDDVSAYTIVNGRAESIMENEYRIVGGDILDRISEHFDDVMNKLLTYGE
ncbi:AAA family ATPase [Aeromonas bivalvium]|uniref:AAA family ATPase n=1 Tax=Aeromonas bivalvium TaxID=440079 RepID=UPI00370B61DF